MDQRFDNYGYPSPQHFHPEFLRFRAFDPPTCGSRLPFGNPTYFGCERYDFPTQGPFFPNLNVGPGPCRFERPFPPVCNQFSPPLKRSDYWNFPYPQLDPPIIPLNRRKFPTVRQRYNIPKQTSVPVSFRMRSRYHCNTQTRIHNRFRSCVKRLGNPPRQTLSKQILLIPPARDVKGNCPPYPVVELNAARKKLIDELYSSCGGIRLSKVRQAVGVVTDFPIENENKYNMSYDQQASFLMTVPLPSPPKDDSNTDVKDKRFGTDRCKNSESKK